MPPKFPTLCGPSDCLYGLIDWNDLFERELTFFPVIVRSKVSKFIAFF